MGFGGGRVGWGAPDARWYLSRGTACVGLFFFRGGASDFLFPVNQSVR